jgi:hypothetical protein
MRFTFVILLFCGLGANAQMIIKAHANYRPYAVAAANLLLDDYPNAAAAYSLRKLDKDYTGNAIRVRRSNDNSEQDIGFTSSGDLDTSALKSFVGANSGFVTIWYDQTGSGRVIGNSTALQQPIIIQLGTIQRQNNKPCIVFGAGGANTYLNNDTIKLPLVNRSVFFVMRQLSIRTAGFGGDDGFFGLNPPPGGGNNDFNVTSAYEFQGQNTSANRQYGAFGSTSVSYQLQKNGSSNIVPYSLLSEIKGGSSASLYENGTLITTDNSFTEFASQSHGGFVIGARYFTNLAIQLNTNSSFQEFIYWGANQSSNRTGIENNINDYYNIYWNGDFAGLLDSFPSSAAAYSLRNLDKDYLGPLVRVRRSSDNAEQDIFGDYYGNLDTIGLKNFVGANSGFVTTWYDQSGNARNATQTTAANQPRVVNAGTVERQGNRPTVFFDGSNDYFDITAFLTNQNISLYYVQKRRTSSVTGVYLGGNSSGGGGPLFVHFFDNNIYIQYTRTPFWYYKSSSNNTSAFNLLEGYTNGITQNIYLNNNTLSLSSEISFSPVTFSWNSIGRYSNGNFPDGIGSEIILYHSYQLSNRNGISTNINTYYSIY